MNREIKLTIGGLTLLCMLGWVLLLVAMYKYQTKPIQVNECNETYDLKKIETAGKLCNSQDGVITSYRISDSYSGAITVSMDCEFNN